MLRISNLILRFGARQKFATANRCFSVGSGIGSGSGSGSGTGIGSGSGTGIGSGSGNEPSDEDLVVVTPWGARDTRNESLSAKRARLVYQSRKRGILENDLLLGGFAELYIETLSETELEAYDQLANGGYNEWDIYYWISGAKQPPEEISKNILTKLQEYANNSAKHYWYKKETVIDSKINN